MKKIISILITISFIISCKTEDKIIYETRRYNVVVALYEIENGKIKHRHILRNDANYNLEDREPHFIKMFNELNNHNMMEGFLFLDPIKGNEQHIFIYNNKLSIDGKEIDIRKLIKYRTNGSN